MNCVACENTVANDEVLTCTTCMGRFHYECLNITKSSYTNILTKSKNTWRCMQCDSITRRSRNDNTPVHLRRQLGQSLFDETNMSVDDHLNDDRSILGDTITIDRDPTPAVQSQPNCTLDQISKLLDTKLEANRKSILNEIKSTIQSEINLAICKLKNELSQKTTMLTNEQANLKKDLNMLTEKITTMESEYEKLKYEIKLISERSNTYSSKPNSEVDYSKNIVLYGLHEHNRETELELNERIICLFRDILNVNLTGYIEDLTRLGKRGPRRPIVIELISKRMTKYILQNSRFFRNTGFAVSAYLTGNALEERKQLREQYLNARKSGKNATLRGSRLFIDGKMIGDKQSTSRQTSQSEHALTCNPVDTQSKPTQKSYTIAEMLETFRKNCE